MNEIYPIWSNIISYLNEINKIKLRILDSITKDIVDNSFNLKEVLGRWRYANKKLSFLFQNEKNMNLQNEKNLDTLSHRFLSYWGVTCTFVIIDDTLYLKVQSVLRNSHYYYVAPSNRFQINCDGFRSMNWIHSWNTFNITDHQQANNLIFHFKEESIKFKFSNKFVFSCKILNHQEKRYVHTEIHNTNRDFINCSLCRNISGIVKEIKNDEFVKKLYELKKTYSYFRITYSMWDSNYLTLLNTSSHGKNFVFFLCFKDNSTKEITLPFELHDIGSLSTHIIYPGYVCLNWRSIFGKLYSIVNLRTGQIITFDKREYNFWQNCHFFEDLKIGFAFDYQNNKLHILNQLGQLKHFLFDNKISRVVMCTESYSMIVVTTDNQVSFFNLLPIVK